MPSIGENGGGTVALSSPRSIQPASSQTTPVVSNVNPHNRKSIHHQYNNRQQRAFGFSSRVQQQQQKPRPEKKQHRSEETCSSRSSSVVSNSSVTTTDSEEGALKDLILDTSQSKSVMLSPEIPPLGTESSPPQAQRPVCSAIGHPESHLNKNITAPSSHPMVVNGPKLHIDPAHSRDTTVSEMTSNSPSSHEKNTQRGIESTLDKVIIVDADDDRVFGDGFGSGDDNNGDNDEERGIGMATTNTNTTTTTRTAVQNQLLALLDSAPSQASSTLPSSGTAGTSVLLGHDDKHSNPHQSSCWMSLFHRMEHEHQVERETWQRELHAATSKQGKYKSELKQNINQQLVWLEERVMAPKHVLPGIMLTGKSGDGNASSRSTASTSDSTSGSALPHRRQYLQGCSAKQNGFNKNVMQLFVEEDAQIISAAGSNAGIEVTFDSAAQMQRLHELEQCLQDTMDQHQRDRLEWLQTLEDAASVTAKGEHFSAQQQEQLLTLQSEVDSTNNKQRKQWKEKIQVLSDLLSLTEEQHQSEKVEWQAEQERLEKALSEVVADFAELSRETDTVNAEKVHYKQAATTWMQKTADADRSLHNNEEIITRAKADVRQVAIAQMDGYRLEMEAKVAEMQRLQNLAADAHQQEMERQAKKLRREANDKHQEMERIIEHMKKKAEEARKAEEVDIRAKVAKIQELHKQAIERQQKEITEKVNKIHQEALVKQSILENHYLEVKMENERQAKDIQIGSNANKKDVEQVIASMKHDHHVFQLQKQKEIDQLRQGSLAQGEEMKTLQTALVSLQSDYDKVQNDLAESHNEAIVAQEEANNAKEIYAKAQNDAVLAREELEKLKEEATMARELAAKAREEADTFREYAADFTEQATISKKQCTILQKNLAAADSPCRSGKELLTVSSIPSSDMGDKMDRALAQRDLYFQESEALQKERLSLKDQLLILESELDSLKQKSFGASGDSSIADARDFALKYKDTMEKHSSLVSRLKRIEEQRDNERGSWKLQLEAVLAELRDIEQEKLALEQTLVELTTSHVAELEEQHVKLSALENENSKFVNENTQVIADLQRQLAQFDNRDVSTEQSNKQLLELTHTENVALVKRVDELSKSLVEYKRLHGMAVKKYERALTDRNELKEKLDAAPRIGKALTRHKDILSRNDDTQQSNVLNVLADLRSEISGIRTSFEDSLKSKDHVEPGKLDDIKKDLVSLQKNLEGVLANLTVDLKDVFQTRGREEKTLATGSHRDQGETTMLIEQQKLLLLEFSSLKEHWDHANAANIGRELVAELQQKEAALAIAQTELRHAKEMLESEIASRQIADAEVGVLNDQADMYEEELALLQSANKRLAKKLRSAGWTIDESLLSSPVHDDSSIGGSTKDERGGDTSLPMLDEAIALAEGLTNIVHGRGQFERQASALEMLESMSEMMDDHDLNARQNKQPTEKAQYSISPRTRHRTKVYDDLGGVEVIHERCGSPLNDSDWHDDKSPKPVETPNTTRLQSSENKGLKTKNQAALQAVVEQLYGRCQLLERERVDMMETTLDLLESARDANAAELEVALATARRKSTEEIMRLRDQNRIEQERTFHKLCSRIVREGNHLTIDTAALEDIL